MARYPQIEALLEATRRTLRAREMSRRTEVAYLGWIRRFLLFHGSPHPDTLSRRHAIQYLEQLANEGGLAANSRNQAASALAFLYREVLGSDAMERVPRAKGPQTVPVVLSHREAMRVLADLSGKYHVISALLYGTGMRVAEALATRVKDLDFDLDQIAVRGGKGAKDRMVPLPHQLRHSLKRQCAIVRRVLRQDRDNDAGWARLPGALHRKDPTAGYDFRWQFVFPASRLSTDRATGRRGRWHLNASAVQREVKRAGRASGIPKRVTCHTFRHNAESRIMPSRRGARTATGWT